MRAERDVQAHQITLALGLPSFNRPFMREHVLQISGREFLAYVPDIRNRMRALTHCGNGQGTTRANTSPSI
jgi:hypothetical protein